MSADRQAGMLADGGAQMHRIDTNWTRRHD